jgi:hypothetical protein
LAQHAAAAAAHATLPHSSRAYASRSGGDRCGSQLPAGHLPFPFPFLTSSSGVSAHFFSSCLSGA